jgi:hypothetical protein
VVTLALAPAAAAEPCRAPPLRRVQAAARRAAGLDELPRWRGRARAAALLPYLSLRAGRTLDWDDTALTRATEPEVDHQVVLEARMTWRLDRLLYEPAEPRLLEAERAVARARAALDAEVTTLYFRWRRAELAREPAPDAEVGDAGDGAAVRRVELDADEALAQLDARTGGWLATEWGCAR